jgi:energy-coupling factor transporter ATP-binding protein EcfA2
MNPVGVADNVRGELTTSLQGACQLFQNSFAVGGVQVHISGERKYDAVLVPPLDSFCARHSAPDIEIQVEWVPRILESRLARTFDSGTTWQLYESRSEFQFDFSSEALGNHPYKRLLTDKKFSKASLQMSEEYFFRLCHTANPLEYPLDELLIMHRLTQERAIELHGVGMVGPDGVNNLFVGHSGAGKSTTARLWSSLHPMKILSDDRIIVRQNPPRDLQFSESPGQIFMYGTPWHGEACFALPDRAPLDRIFILEHGQGNVLAQFAKSSAVAELFARSFVPFHHHQYIESALSFLEQLVETIPCYRYSFEPDARAVEKILQFHD